MVASFKAGRDGIAQALGIDDKRFRMHTWVSEEVGARAQLREINNMKATT